MQELRTLHYRFILDFSLSLIIFKMYNGEAKAAQLPYNGPPTGKWTTGLCGCFEDPGSCKLLNSLCYVAQIRVAYLPICRHLHI